MIRLAGIIGGVILVVMVWFALRESQGPAPAPAAGIVPPSGQPIRLIETVSEAPGTQGLAIRYRFLAPEIARNGGSIDAETAQVDMEWLCNSYAVPRLSAMGPVPSQIIISLADREVGFGEPAPEATQFFGAYVVEDGRCVWEAF